MERTSVFRERSKQAFVKPAAIFFFPTFFFGPSFLAAFMRALNGETAEATISSYDETASPLPDRHKQRGAGDPGKRSPLAEEPRATM